MIAAVILCSNTASILYRRVQLELKQTGDTGKIQIKIPLKIIKQLFNLVSAKHRDLHIL